MEKLQVRSSSRVSKLINGQAPCESCIEDAQGEARRKSLGISFQRKDSSEGFQESLVDTVLVIPAAIFFA